MDRGRKGIVDFNAGKTQLFFFFKTGQSNNTGVIDVRKMLGLPFSSKLDCDYRIIYAANKTASKKIWALIRSIKFLSPEVALYLYKSTISLAWNTVAMSGMMLLTAVEMLNKLQKQICRTAVPSLTPFLESLDHCRKIASLSFFLYVLLW